MTDLHPDVVEAIRNLSNSKLGRRYNRFARRRYGVSGPLLAGKTVAGEFGGRSTRTGRGVVSSAGARGPAQFIPSTRAAYIERHGVDPWAGDSQAIKGMMLHHLDTGVEGYNPGMPTYRDYILDQRLNRKDRRALRGSTRPVGGSVQLNGPQRTEVSLRSRTIPGQSFAKERQGARRELLLGGDLDLGRLLEYKQTINSLRDIPDRRVRGDIMAKRSGGQPFKVPVGKRANGPAVKAPGDIYEVFYDPLKRYWDSGGIHRGAIGGHGTHIHVAGAQELVVRLGKVAQEMGLDVGENSAFDGETPTSGHADESFHYNNEAIDVSGGTPAQRRKFARIVMREARRRGR